MTTRRRKDKLPPQSEADWQNQVVLLAELLGWRVFHVRRSSGWSESQQRRVPYVSDKGWPDLVLAKQYSSGARVLFREVKKDDGKLEPDQEWWGNVLMLAGCDWAVWRPRDFERVKRELGGE